MDVIQTGGDDVGEDGYKRDIRLRDIRCSNRLEGQGNEIDPHVECANIFSIKNCDRPAE